MTARDEADHVALALGPQDEVARDSRVVAARLVAPERTELANLPMIDPAPALGRVTGLTGKDNVIWLRACVTACTTLVG